MALALLGRPGDSRWEMLGGRQRLDVFVGKSTEELSFHGSIVQPSLIQRLWGDRGTTQLLQVSSCLVAPAVKVRD